MDETRGENDPGLKRRGSGISLSLNRTPSKSGGSRPNSLDRNGLRDFQDWQQQQYGGYPPMQHQPQGPYPILVNPPPMPTVSL